MEDLLTHYTSFEHFTEILNNQYFIAFYNKEEITSELKENSQDTPTFLIPMVCFCDSDVNLTKHINDYGDVGISFYKKWAINRGLIPVMYIHRKTKIFGKLKALLVEYAVKYGHADAKEKDNILKSHKDLFTITLFTKPYEGYFEKIKKEKCYYFEREWRFIPELEHQVEYAQSEELIRTINNNIKSNNQFYLYFGINEIANIFTTNSNLEKLVSLLTKIDKKELIGKIRIITN